MIYWGIGFLVLVVWSAISILYHIGKKVKEREKAFGDMFNERNAKQNLDRYKRKSTPKVPTIKR